jgi:hypothetical protein
MSDLSSFVEGIIGQLGRSFFVSGFVPMLLLVAVNQYVFFAPPLAAGPVFNLFPAITTPWLGLFSGEMLTTVVAALALGFVVMPLNTFIIKLFEGLGPGMKAILFPFMLARSAQYRQRYLPIQTRRAERLAMMAGVENGAEYHSDADFQLQNALDQLHSQMEAKEPVQTLPYNLKRLTPTMYGNAWAVMEEYPLVRYGMDSMVFWPYIRVVMFKENDGLLVQIDNQKLLIDFVTHMALVLGILTLEGLVATILHPGIVPLVATLVALWFAWVFYQSGVSYVRTMGLLISQAFDLYRLKLLDLFDVARPATLDDEYWVWNRLAAFLRRGEPFYFDMIERVKKGP